MAKIMIVSEKISETTWLLAKTLRDQQHEIILLTSHGQVVQDDVKNIQIMAYFKKWNLFETVRLLPHLVFIYPQIFHLILDEDKVRFSQLILSFFAKALPDCILTTSLLHIREGLSSLNPTRYIVEQSDIITCPSAQSLHHLKGLDIKNSRQGRGILAPVLNLREGVYEKQEHHDHLAFSFLKTKSYIMLPMNESQFNKNSAYFKHLALMAKKFIVVLVGSFEDWNFRQRNMFTHWMKSQGLENRWVLTGTHSFWLSPDLLSQSHAFSLAGISLSPQELTQYYRQLRSSGAPLILDSAQAGIHSALWQNGVNCWILEKSRLTQEMIPLLQKESLKLTENVTDQMLMSKDALDTPINDLNRLYSRALRSLS